MSYSQSLLVAALLATPAVGLAQAPRPLAPLQEAARLDHEGKGDEARLIYQRVIDSLSAARAASLAISPC